MVLPGISASTLRQLITFIYTGEVQVTEEFLEPLLEAAEMLQVRGLTEQNGDNSSGGGGGGSRRRSNESSVSADNSAKKRMRMSEEEHNEQSQVKWDSCLKVLEIFRQDIFDATGRYSDA